MTTTSGRKILSALFALTVTASCQATTETSSGDGQLTDSTSQDSASSIVDADGVLSGPLDAPDFDRYGDELWTCRDDDSPWEDGVLDGVSTLFGFAMEVDRTAFQRDSAHAGGELAREIASNAGLQEIGSLPTGFQRSGEIVFEVFVGGLLPPDQAAEAVWAAIEAADETPGVGGLVRCG